MPEFNLLDEPFVLVEDNEGRLLELSLREVFRQAPRLRRLVGDVPTQEFAFLRILLAVIYDSARPNESDWRRMRREGLPSELIDTYLDQWHERFWLFDQQRPFMQVAGLRTSRDEASGLEKLIADIPNGEPLFSMRTSRGIECITPAEAARWLVHCQAFDPSGIRSGAIGDELVKYGKGFPIGPAWSGQLGGVVFHGPTLEQTLVLNLVPLREDMTDEDDDRPVWALDEPPTAARADFTEADPPGTVSLLTWQSRRIRLVGDLTGVTGVVLAQGDKMTPQNRHRHEILTGWRYSKPQSKKLGGIVYMPRKHDAERSMWRSLPSMLAESGDSDGHALYLPAETVRHLANAEQVAGEIIPVRLQTIGMTYGSQEAIVEELISDEMDLSTALLTAGGRGTELRGLVDDAIQSADATARALGQLASNLVRAQGEKGEKAGEHASGAARTRFYAGIDHGARTWIGGLSGGSEIEASLARWQAYLRRVAWSFARELLDACGDRAVIGRPVAGVGGASLFMTAGLAEKFFTGAIDKALPHSRPQIAERTQS